MKIAYLIFAYRNPELIRLEVEALSKSGDAFFVHIDRKVDLNVFSAVRGENVSFLYDRELVYWAEFSGVRAILRLIRAALEDVRRFEYLTLLSGSEYPLRSSAYIQEFLERNRDCEFIDSVRIPNADAGKPVSHINTVRYESSRPVLRFMGQVLSRTGYFKRDFRKYLGDLEPYGGHTWWTLSRGACEYILNFSEKRRSVVRFFEDTPQPEETFIHTILGNSPFQDRMRRSLLFEDWSAGGAHPAIINEAHVAYFESMENICVSDAFGSGEVLFARKFSDENLSILGRMNKIIETIR